MSAPAPSGAEGIVWIACDENQERISNLIRSTDVPVILINREMDVDAACVTNDNRRGACLRWNACCKTGTAAWHVSSVM